MNDDKHVDRYVRITNRERFLIVRALSLLKTSCETLQFAYRWWDTPPELQELYKLSYIFCEENWLVEQKISTPSKVKGIEENDDDYKT